MNKRWNEKYEAPTLEVITVAVELGFGTSTSNDAFDDDDEPINPPLGA